MSEAETRAEGRREGAPAALMALLVLVLLAFVSWARDWRLLDLPWWIWLVLAIPALLLTIDLTLAFRYLSLTNSIAFSPTDAMPLSLRAKAMMGIESGISAVTVLLVAARAVNVLGS